MVFTDRIPLADDSDNSEAVRRYRSSLDGADYEIDLNSGHAEQLRDALTALRAAVRQASAKNGYPRTT